ncbi:hypothetical protein VTK73DRAFT_3450 [Phialemonium thermophilum]|uniref:Alpha-1,3-mannosyltransferase CMT1 n=1 Tax=Phialemonium thermophilum TaxID=223376 RepID=A0ABR3WYV4_9PEZI
MRLKLRLLYVLPALCFTLVATSLYLGRDHFSRLAWSSAPGLGALRPSPHPADPAARPSEAAKPIPSPTYKVPGNSVLSTAEINSYVRAVFNPTSSELPRIKCPPLNTFRYEPLRSSKTEEGDSHETTTANHHHIDYFFVLNLRHCVSILPSLLGSVVEAMRYLGPQRCALSIVEGNSQDGTPEVLAGIQEGLMALGVGGYFLQRSDINPIGRREGNRVSKLGDLRNMALQPLFDMGGEDTQRRNDGPVADDDTAVLFINDVVPCVEDLLELLLQLRVLDADMTCAMDWTFIGEEPAFYDVWVSRTITGDSFFEVPNDGSWDRYWNLFWNAPAEATRHRFVAHQPFQVFSCWNGAVAFGAGPLLHQTESPAGRARDKNGGKPLPPVRFRGPREDHGECMQGEPQLFCKDLWARGHGRVAVVPSVNLEYSIHRGQDVKRLRGFVSDLVGRGNDDPIQWVDEPPEQVKCMPSWTNQYWQPWDAGLWD